MKKRRVLTLSAYENLQRTPASEENCTASTGPNKLNSSISKTEIKFWKRKKKNPGRTKGINWTIIKMQPGTNTKKL